MQKILSLDELQVKLGQIRDNAYLYNPEGNVVRSEADRFLKVADKCALVGDSRLFLMV